MKPSQELYAEKLLLLFSHSVISSSLQPHGLQHARLPCPSPSPGTCWNSYPLSPWCHLTISSSVVPFSRLQSFPASGSFQINQLFTSGGQSIGASASAPVLSMNIQSWFPFGFTTLNSLQSKGLQHSSSKASVLRCSAFFIVQLSHLYISVCPIAQGGLDLYKGRVSVQIPSRTLLHTSLVLMKQGRVRGFLPGPFSAERPRKGIGLPTTQACPVWLHTCLWSPKSHSREEISDWLNAPGTVIPHALI